MVSETTVDWERELVIEAMHLAGRGPGVKPFNRTRGRMQSVQLDPAREIVTNAYGVQALIVTIRCVLDLGDEALVLTPAWPNGASIVAMSNARPMEIPHPLASERYEIDWDRLEAAV